MRQYTTSDQTAKLIELGFEKPKRTFTFKLIEYNDVKTDIDIPVSNYSMGELVSFLPPSLPIAPYNPPLSINYDNVWHIYYGVQEEYSWETTIWVESKRKEFIDAVYDMIIRLKKKELI